MGESEQSPQPWTAVAVVTEEAKEVPKAVSGRRLYSGEQQGARCHWRYVSNPTGIGSSRGDWQSPLLSHLLHR